MDIRSAANMGPRVRVKFVGKGRTSQSSRNECDVNKIMAKYEKTGAISHLAKHGGDYGFATGVSFHEAMNVVTKAGQMFDELPAVVRRRFTEPATFLDFVQNPANLEEMVEMGLASKKLAPDEAPGAPGGEGAAAASAPASAPPSSAAAPPSAPAGA